ncbi:hypothetical protein [Paenibacillus piri]|uniref:Uncharacterized protein n=1 Tax=Paenibacillus piri TaxID=2547395 RepID=A0A4V6PIC6_9BACL|nr:hypothetical protein [Paenibacillus piri]TDF91844.1 hypothetical protein E1757_31375 [Paenibacillus piri]
MRHIHPISEASCREHYGKPVLVILKDGGEIAGILTKVGPDTLVLNGEADISSGKSRSPKRNMKSKRINHKAEVSFSPFPNTGFGGGGLVLDLALIALLFAFF